MANRLKKMLTEEMVRLDPPLLSTPEEVIEYCGNILVENKKAKAGYVKEMIDSYQRFGPYMVMAPGLALPHARPGGNVKEPCISFVKLKEPVCFIIRVMILFGLCSRSEGCQMMGILSFCRI